MVINKRKIKSFLRQHRTASILIILAVIVAISLIIYNYYLLDHIKFKAPSLVYTKEQKETRVQAPLTGLLIDPSRTSYRPLAVVIENHPDARPQSGYDKADLVYETIAEGGITRTLAIYQSQDTNEIGPVRSARDYFIDWLSEYNAAFIHVGGNSDALAKIATNHVPDINQFYYGNYFWRSTARYAPHNVYTTTAKLYSALEKAAISKTTTFSPLTFKKDLAEKDRPISQNITINFSSAQFVVGYSYNPKTNSYLRSLAGLPHKDKVTGEQLSVKNIVVQYESMSPGKSHTGEQKTNIITTGKGKMVLFQDGKAITGFWEKTGGNSKTKLIDSLGNEIKFNPGQTWFEIVPQTASVTY